MKNVWLRLSFIVIIALIILIPVIINAGDWEKPWSEVKHKSVALCRANFDNFQLQTLCMENEKDGYKKMQGNFGMPKDVADKAKERCAKVFDSFQLQALCMENESEGYEEMNRY